MIVNDLCTKGLYHLLRLLQEKVKKNIDFHSKADKIVPRKEVNMTYGETLKEERHKKKITLEDLSSLLGCTRQAVSNWERNLCLPNKECQNKLSIIFSKNFVVKYMI